MKNFCLKTEFANDLSSDPLNQKIFRYLKRAITECQILPGEQISENEIAGQFDFKISRQPVREALIKLSENKFVEIAPKKGTKVSKISKKDVLQGIEIRCALEGIFIKRAVLNFSKNAILDLEENLKLLKQAIEDNNLKEIFILNNNFHKIILKEADMIEAWPVIDKIKNIANRVCFLAIHFNITENNISYKDHQKILDAIKTQDPIIAQKVFIEHLQSTKRQLRDIMEICPQEWFCE